MTFEVSFGSPVHSLFDVKWLKFENSADLYAQLKDDIDAHIPTNRGLYNCSFAGFCYEIWSNTNHFGLPRTTPELCFEIEYTPPDPANPPIPWQWFAPTKPTWTIGAENWTPPDYSNKRAIVEVVRIGVLKTSSEDYRKEFEHLDIKQFEERDRIDGWRMFPRQERLKITKT